MDGNGNLIPIFDPTTGQQFQYNGQLNVIPPGPHQRRLRPRCCSTFLILIVPVAAPADLLSNKSFAPFVNPIIQHVWGFIVDQTLTPTQSLHYSQWRNSYSNAQLRLSPAGARAQSPQQPES